MLARERTLDSLLEFADQLHVATPSDLPDQALKAALQMFEGEGAALLLARHRTHERRIWCVSGAAPTITPANLPASEFCRMVLRTGHPMAVPDLQADARVGLEDRCPGVAAGPALFVPLRLRERAVGVLCVYRPHGRERFSPDEVRLASLLASCTAMMLENRRLAEGLAKMAVTDDLTQVHNYRFLKTALRREIKRAGRFNQQLSLLMIDVDGLKGYNDRNGHMRGSLLLKEIAGLFAQNVRSWDLVAKYGGDEFTVILPQTGREGALVAAERLRAVVEGHAFPLVPQGAITVSLGVATFPEDASDAIGLIRASDRALYEAKQKGRNRVAVYEERAA